MHASIDPSRSRTRAAALLFLVAGCDLRCSDRGECRNIDIDELYCPALSDPFDTTCTGRPGSIRVGEVVDANGLLVLTRDSVIDELAGGDADLHAQWESAVFEQRAEAVPSQEFDCDESIGAVVDKIGLDLKASAVRHIEVDIRPIYCDGESASCFGDADAASPFIETMPASMAGDDYTDAVLAAVGDRDDVAELRFVTAAYVGNVEMVLEAENGFHGKVTVPVGESLQLGLKVDVVEDREIRLSTGSPDGPFGYTLAHTDVALTDL